MNDLVRPDQQRLLDRQSYSPGSTQVNRHEALALRFQSLSSVTFESCLHSVARTSQACLVVPPEPFDAACRERAFRVLLQLPARDQVLTTFVYVQNDRQHRRPSVHFSLLVSSTLVLSRGVVWADLGEVQHESALDLCEVRPADSQGSALHDSNRPGAVAQPRRRLRKGPGSQEQRGLQKGLDGGVKEPLPHARQPVYRSGPGYRRPLRGALCPSPSRAARLPSSTSSSAATEGFLPSAQTRD